MAVPKATVDEDHLSTTGKDDVRAPLQLLAVQAIAETVGPEPSADNHLRLGVLSFNQGHPLATLFLGERVDHFPNLFNPQVFSLH